MAQVAGSSPAGLTNRLCVYFKRNTLVTYGKKAKEKGAMK